VGNATTLQRTQKRLIMCPTRKFRADPPKPASVACRCNAGKMSSRPPPIPEPTAHRSSRAIGRYVMCDEIAFGFVDDRQTTRKKGPSADKARMPLSPLPPIES
jgi:hypothetical protein